MYYLLSALPRFGGSAVDVHDELVVETLSRAEEQGLITAEHIFHDSWLYTLTSTGKGLVAGTPTSVRIASMIDMNLMPDGSKAAMWDWMLLHGGGPSAYGTDGLEAYDDEYLHVCACGLDIDACSEVRDGSWTTFNGTFAEDGYYKGLLGYATCRCGEVEKGEVRGTVESLARLIREITS